MKQTFALIAACTIVAAASAQTSAKDPVYTKTNPPPWNGAMLPQPIGSPLVGGADDCVTPDAIAGTGAFAVDTTAATNSVGGPAPCASIGRDVWFAWTAPGSCATIETCGGSTSDTVLAVYNGTTCPPTTQIACADDSCGLQSRVAVSTVPGNVYLIRVGSFSTGAGWVGTMTISTPAPGVGDDDCSTPTILSPGPGVYPFDTSTATTGCEGQTNASCLFFSTTGIGADRWYTYTSTVNGTTTVSTCGLVTTGTDTKVAIYAGAGCPTAAAIACNDDAACPAPGSGLNSTVTFNVVCGGVYTIQLGKYPTTATAPIGMFSIVETGLACGPSGVPFCFGDGSGTPCPCGNSGAAGNGCANSVNANGGNIAATGNPSIASDTLVLQGTGMPNSSCLYFQGTTQAGGGLGTVFGDGLRCAGGSVIRLGTKTNVAGASQYPEPGDLSVSVRGANAAGDVRTYQAWYRNADPVFCTAATFNLTNGTQVTWLP